MILEMWDTCLNSLIKVCNLQFNLLIIIIYRCTSIIHHVEWLLVLNNCILLHTYACSNYILYLLYSNVRFLIFVLLFFNAHVIIILKMLLEFIYDDIQISIQLIFFSSQKVRVLCFR